MNRYAICPGSFDPVTLGHENIVRRAAAIFGKCEVLVMNNENKEYLLSLQDRFELCRAAFDGEENITVSCYAGQLLDYVKVRPEAVLVKGIRNAADLAYEKPMSLFHRKGCGTETFYLDAEEAFKEISSTRIRALLAKNGEVGAYLSEKVVKLLQNKL